MRVHLLGGLSVEGKAERDLGSRKGRTLLKVLAGARGAPVSVDRLAEILWGEGQPSHPADQIGVLVSRLRGVLGADRITRSDAGYALVVDWLDVVELDELAAEASSALVDGRVGAARAAAASGLALARGTLLPDEDGEWVEAERAAVAATVTLLRRIGVDAAVAAGDHSGAAALAEQALADDPYDEVVLRSLMEAHLAVGRPSSALAAYARCRRRLVEDLGVPPTAETEAVHGRALVAADGDTVSAPAPARRAPADVVGRDAELAALDAALEKAVGGDAALVVVEGDAGIGKTTLVDTWADLVADRAVVLRGRCDELGRDLPLQPITDALADHLRGLGAEAGAELVGADESVLAPLLGPVTGGAATVVANVDAGRTRVFAALVALVSRAGRDRPVVLVIEDLHLAGNATLAWLAFARRRCRSTAIVTTTRPGGAPPVDEDDHITLGPLTRDAVADLVGAERADVLHDRSGGHPLLLAALAAAGDEALPATVRDAVGASVDSLGAGVAATLRAAAALGSECDLELIGRVAESPVVDVLRDLETAVQVGLIVERGDRFAFRHELIREALEAATGAARRSLFHRRAALALAARPGRDHLAVAVHAREGGDPALASASFVAAAEAAAGRFDVEAAEHHLASAIELAPGPDAYVVRARVRTSTLAFEAAAADAARAISLGGGAPALEVAGWVAYYRRRYDDARAFADEAASRAGDDALRVSALALAGRIRHASGDLAGAVEHLASVGEGPLSVRGVADVWLGLARVHQGRPVDALQALARPLVDPDALAHPWAPLHMRFNRVMALGQLGRVSEALSVVADLDAAVERAGAVGVRFTGHAANVGAWILRWSGLGSQADERNWRAVEVTGGSTGPSHEGLAEGFYVALLDLADGCLLRGATTEAAALVDRLAPVADWQGTMAWHQRHRFGLLQARLALVDGDADRAAGLAAAVADDAAGRSARRYELLARALQGVADPSIPIERLVPVVEGLGRCAALDGWPLVAALARDRRSDGLRAEAERHAAAVVDVSPHRDAAGAFVDRVLRG